MKTKRKSSTALITGATSGIGKSFAYKLAEKGYHLILVGRRELELNSVANDLKETYKVHVDVMVGDLSLAKFRKSIAQKIKSNSSVDFLVNNAGFGIDHDFFQIKVKDLRSMVMTHDMATIELTHAVLPGMLKRKKGRIINVSSLGAFIPGFTRSLYLATKSFIHYFTKALSIELKPHGIKVQSLCPGMTLTDFHDRDKTNAIKENSKFLNYMMPDKVAKISLHSLENGKTICIPGFINKIIVLIAKILPCKLLGFLSSFRRERPTIKYPHTLYALVA
ncbi:MAG: short-chain dehydrogenase [Marinilabiliales bacterium]|nr:MAG: short-chain dehydrogenase [Marinilabiliales bacterium]